MHHAPHALLRSCPLTLHASMLASVRPCAQTAATSAPSCARAAGSTISGGWEALLPSEPHAPTPSAAQSCLIFFILIPLAQKRTCAAVSSLDQPPCPELRRLSRPWQPSLLLVTLAPLLPSSSFAYSTLYLAPLCFACKHSPPSANPTPDYAPHPKPILTGPPDHLIHVADYPQTTCSHTAMGLSLRESALWEPFVPPS